MTRYTIRRRSWPKSIDRRSLMDRIRRRPGKLTQRLKPWALLRDGLFIGAYDSLADALMALPPLRPDDEYAVEDDADQDA